MGLVFSLKNAEEEVVVSTSCIAAQELELFLEVGDLGLMPLSV